MVTKNSIRELEEFSSVGIIKMLAVAELQLLKLYLELELLELLVNFWKNTDQHHFMFQTQHGEIITLFLLNADLTLDNIDTLIKKQKDLISKEWLQI